MKLKKAKIICMTSMKGGVGKTTLTLLLGGIYQKMGKKVLLIDLDLCNGGLALGLNHEPVKTIYQFVDDLTNNRYENFFDYVTPVAEHFDLLASPKDPRQAMKIDSKYIESIIDNACFRYDIILIDSTYAFNKMNLMIMDKSDLLLYLLTNDTFHLKNAKSFFSILKDIEYDQVKVVLNQALSEGREYYSTFDMKNIIGHHIDYILDRELYFRNLDSLLIDGTVLTLLDRNIRGIDKLKNMASELLGGDEDAEEKSR